MVTSGPEPVSAGQPTLLVLGARGRVGRIVRDTVPALGWRLRLLGRTPITLDSGENAEVVTADIHDTERLAEAMRGVAGVLHLAGIPREDQFERILEANIDGTYRVFETASRVGVGRVLYASSNHIVGRLPNPPLAEAPLLGVDVPHRPDSFYGLSKSFGETLGRLYADKRGLRVACLRIGSCMPRPTAVRHLSTWLSPGDTARLLHACLTAPDLHYAVMYGVSANTRGCWDLAPGKAVGYEPQDDAERYAAEIFATHGAPDPDDPDLRYLGGVLAGTDLPSPPRAPGTPEGTGGTPAPGNT